MKHKNGRYIKIMWAVFLLILISTPVWAGQGTSTQQKNDTTSNENPIQPVKWEGAPDVWFIYIVVIVVLAGSVVAIAAIHASLSVSASKWSLAEALSEEVKVTETKEGKTAGATESKEVTRLCASSSRLIALMGMMVILLMFLGFGAFTLYSFGKTGKTPDSIDKVVHFLLAGLTLFAPYTVNKFASIFESLSPKPGGQS